MWLHYVSCSPLFIKTLISFSYKCFSYKIFPILSLLYSLLVVNIGAVNLFYNIRQNVFTFPNY